MKMYRVVSQTKKRELNLKKQIEYYCIHTLMCT